MSCVCIYVMYIDLVCKLHTKSLYVCHIQSLCCMRVMYTVLVCMSHTKSLYACLKSLA